MAGVRLFTGRGVFRDRLTQNRQCMFQILDGRMGMNTKSFEMNGNPVKFEIQLDEWVVIMLL